MDRPARLFLEHEAHALLTRLARIRPFVLSEPMVPAAALQPAAQFTIDRHLALGRQRMQQQVLDFIARLPRLASSALAQREFALLRLRFNAVLAQYDLYADALSQRSDRDLGVWMAGLDALASDTLVLAPGQPRLYAAPPLVCYLDRGIGAAIRRARTRLPGGGSNPAAIIRVPRERMVGSGIATSLVHEVGHQGAALLGLVESLRPQLAARAERAPLWRHWERWVSEILADLWAVARLGLSATLGMVGVLSLPRAFVFRISTEDPHPPPYLRVLIGSAVGAALYPAPAWVRLAQLWRSLYPLEALPVAARHRLQSLAAGVPALVQALLGHRTASLQGRCLGEVVADPALCPQRLQARLRRWQNDPASLLAERPAVACALLGLARLQGQLAPDSESRWMARLLVQWAVRPALRAPSPPACPTV